MLTIVVVGGDETGVRRVAVTPSRVLHVVAVRVAQSVLEWTAREDARFLRWTSLFKERSSRRYRTHIVHSNTNDNDNVNILLIFQSIRYPIN